MSIDYSCYPSTSLFTTSRTTPLITLAFPSRSRMAHTNSSIRAFAAS